MEPIQCFLLTKTDRAHRYLRRYVSGSWNQCPTEGYHHARVQIEDGPVDASGDLWDHSDSRWSTHCPCGYAFTDDDNWQLFVDGIWVAADGHEYELAREGHCAAPPGAMWDCDWMHDIPAWCGPDGCCMCVRLPDGTDWIIDSRASNCTMPNDTVHRCWVRHGEPPNLHVDKNGNTCAAGAGSIGTPTWHGFLHHGCLVIC